MKPVKVPLITKLRDSASRTRKRLSRFSHRSSGFLKWCEMSISSLAALASLLCLICLVIHVGYNHTSDEYRLIHRLLRYSQAVFAINVLIGYILHLKKSLKPTFIIKWLADLAIIITIFTWLYPQPQHPWVPWLSAIVYSNKFLYIILAIYSVITLSQSVSRLIGKRTNPSLLLSCSFLICIILGTFLLMLPKSTLSGISFIDSLFVSTSAVCITGLTPIDIATTFTPMGLLILVVLMQIGALGVMTFTSFFALFFSGNKSIYNQLMLKDIIYSQNMSTLIPTLLYILFFTLTIETAGAILIWFSIHDSLGLSIYDELVFSGFHSISAFCNAGFSNYPDGFSNANLLYGNISIYWIMTLIIIAGSTGFPILVNFKEAFTTYSRRLWHRIRRSRNAETTRVHVYNMNTKIVLYTSGILFLVGALSFFFLEYNHSLAGMTLWEKITQSAFNAATPRSAGFVSVSPAGFLNTTLLIVLFLMWIGGGSQSTAGGIKVNTLAAVLLNVRSILRGQSEPIAYNRTISHGSIRRANAVVVISIISYLVFSFILLILEPDLPPKAVLFETMSALFTVGSSLGITSSLSEYSEIVLCIAMFVGRVGIISLLMGLVKKKPLHGYTLPSDNIIIN